ncbi:MAG: NAD(P)/FAD-dependent oxidoreductase, partial [Anaerolineae bacterium]|nr:NAD(P)/FAD-dependent oxidoreductase [Anaerolineae bacterium]
MTHYDVVIVGGGHNGLVSAAYLAKAGLKVLILERQGQLGGAVQSLQVFKGVAARLSRYSYLLSLFPQKISDDLGLRFESRRRAVASFTPTVRDGAHKALLISNTDEQRTLESFRQLTGSDSEYHAFQRFNHLMEVFAEKVWPTLLQPMVTREAMQARFDDAESREAWEMLVEQPLGVGLERLLQDDRVRGLAFTNAKIGVLTQPHDPTLLQNRTYIYHIIGQGTGEWRVVVGGMGAVSEALEQCARQAGVEIITGAAVERIDAQTGQVHYTRGGRSFEVEGAYVLANVAPSTLEVMLGRPEKAQID